ncbi:GGDEF domain-containing protein [Aminipila sp.]|uniref:GGDEF domain-containing protein n=1 Tax=Aminipila sp. TaxID=2060095 RepID=UPI0028A063F6|nr:GGDEF domain-containing protein [Aminipila sp.]
MDIKNKIVLICNNQFFIDRITSSLEKDCYIVEAMDTIYNEGALDKYIGNTKLVVLEVSKLENTCTALPELINKFRDDENTALLLICSNKQQELAVKAVNMGVIDVILMPCEIEIIQTRINNILKIINLKRQVLRDPLTKIYNRTAFEEMVQRLLKQKIDKAAFIMIDLDDFKYLNDTFGHDVGDVVLIKVADALIEVVDRDDVIGRMGGDEFAIFIPYIYSKEYFINKIKAIFNKLKIQFIEKGKKVTVLSSIGIAFFPEHGIEFNELYRNADTAQYQSKNSGKNKIKIYKN